jgi:hypothetical protein
MQHEKVLAISRRDRLACVGLWMAAGTWSTRNLKDGRVPFHVLDEIGGTERLAVELVRVGLWRRIKTGYLFVNWKEFQPTRADVEADRAAAKERMRSARERKRAEAEAAKATGQNANGSGEHSRTGPERSSTPSRPVPTRPDPSKTSGSDSSLSHLSSARARKPRGMNVGGEWINTPVMCPIHQDCELSSLGTCTGCEADRKAESA